MAATKRLDERVVEGLVDAYRVGDRRSDPDRRDARTWAGFDLALYRLDSTATTRNTLAAIALGAWRPGEAKAKALVSLVAGWYRAGLT